MRWKWRFGFVLVGVVELPILFWAGTVMHSSPTTLAYIGGTIAAALVAMLAVRPLLFGFVGMWLGGMAAGAWYFLRFVPPAGAIALSAVLATLGCAIIRPVYRNAARIAIRRFV